MTPQFQMIETNGIKLRAHVEGEGPLIVLVHGFPESWYSWRHQIKPLVHAGFQVAALDVRGYGGSDKPHDVSAYSMEEITADVAGVAKALGHEQSILIGHDWGAPIVWNTSVVYPDVIRAVAGLSVPYAGLGPAPFIDIARHFYTENGKFFYQEYFQKEGDAEAEFEADVRAFVRKIYYYWSGDFPPELWPDHKKHGEQMLVDMPEPPDTALQWMSQEDWNYYISEFEASGLRGPLNRYRTQHDDYKFMASQPSDIIQQPCFFIGGDRDGAMKMIPGRDLVEVMKKYTPNLYKAEILSGCGHWTQQEKPDDVNKLLVEWLATLP